MTAFDPDAAADPNAGIFGLPTPEADAAAVVVPVPFAPTVSYGVGAELGPQAVREGSLQVDLYDLQFGRVWEKGVHCLEPLPQIEAAHRQARALAAPVIEAGGAGEADHDAVSQVDRICREVHGAVSREVGRILEDGRLPVVLGGDHSCSLGGIQAADSVGPFGILQLDAHADLRAAYEGFIHSHASIIHNLRGTCRNLTRVVQVGIRDVGEGEWRAVQAAGDALICHTDPAWRRRLARGEPLQSMCDEVVAALPDRVWITCDIDGLEPSLCPNTGTPVPGGLSFGEFGVLLETLAESDKRIVGVDLMEVAPGDPPSSWDGNVGARVLYKLIGCALRRR